MSKLFLAINNGLECGLEMVQLLLDDDFIELLVNPADLSNEDKETVVAKQAAELGMGGVHQMAEHANGFVVTRELSVGSTKDALAC